MTAFKQIPDLKIPGIHAEVARGGINIWDTILGDGDCLACLQNYETAIALQDWLASATGYYPKERP